MPKLGESEVEVEEYVFAQFNHSKEGGNVKSYQFADLKDIAPERSQEHEKIIKMERNLAYEKQFKIAPVVEEFRGMSAQAAKEREQRIAEEVSKRVALIKDEAFQEGLAQGQEQGRAEVLEQMSFEVEEKLSYFTEMVHEVLVLKAQIAENQKKEIFMMVKNLVKWILLREISADEDYISRLLEKLIIEMGSKEHLLIHVNEAHFEKMPEVLEVVQKKLGALTNVRVEVDYSMENPGLVLESQNGIINASLAQQFENLEKLFEVVGVPVSSNEGEDNE